MFKYELKTANGDDAGSFESSRCDWSPGDEFIGHGNTRWRIRPIVPRELIAEFHNVPKRELWEVEPL